MAGVDDIVSDRSQRLADSKNALVNEKPKPAGHRASAYYAANASVPISNRSAS